MSEITAQDQYNTKAHAFVARRGALVMKEFLPVGTLSGEYRAKLEVETLIFSSMQAGKIDRTYGLKITVTTRDDGYERDGSCLIDQDELNELVSGLQYLDEKLNQMSGNVPHYTEMVYATKDGFRVGFFIGGAAEEGPTVFCQASNSDNAFMQPSRLVQLHELIRQGQESLNQMSY